MTSIDLHNLIMGNKRPSERWASAQVGPFHVTLAADYEEKVARIGVHGSRTVTQDFVAGEHPDDPMIQVKTTTFAEQRRCGWEAVPQQHRRRSILNRVSLQLNLSPTADFGTCVPC